MGDDRAGGGETLEKLMVRPLSARDLPALRALEVVAKADGVQNVTLLVDAMEGGGAAEIAMLGAWRDGRLVGVGGLSQCPDVPGAQRVRRFFVSPEARRAGVGRALARAVLAMAEGATVTCNAQASHAAPPFWESLGFKRADRNGITHLLHAIPKEHSV
jgi:GNAT superfamily N-acetyltransferase